VGACHHSMACSWVADGRGSFHILMVFANVLNKQSQTTNKGWPSSFGVRWGVTTPNHIRISTLWNVTHHLRIGWSLWNNVGNGKWL